MFYLLLKSIWFTNSQQQKLHLNTPSTAQKMMNDMGGGVCLGEKHLKRHSKIEP